MTDTPATVPGSVTESQANLAMRLGWMVAECEGRLRPDAPPRGTQKTRSGWTLPLDAADERSAVEMQVEATKVLASVSGRAEADMPIDDLTYQDAAAFPGLSPPTAPNGLSYLVSRLLFARDHALGHLCATLSVPPLTADEQNNPPDAASVWVRIEQFIWAWDAAIQDQLASGDFGTASAYQLGRGLAESYWALNPDDPANDDRSWSRLLGTNRVTALQVLCRRLSSSIGTSTASAVSASLDSWREVAKDPKQYIEPKDSLGDQLLIWRDVLLAQRDPTSLVPKDQLERNARRIFPLIKAFKGELFIGAAAAVALGASAYYLPGVGGAIGTVLSAFGITATAVGSKAKATIQTVGQRVRDKLNQDAIDAAVVKVPRKTTVAGLLGIGTKPAKAQELVAALKP